MESLHCVSNLGKQFRLTLGFIQHLLFLVPDAARLNLVDVITYSAENLGFQLPPESGFLISEFSAYLFVQALSHKLSLGLRHGRRTPRQDSFTNRVVQLMRRLLDGLRRNGQCLFFALPEFSEFSRNRINPGIDFIVATTLVENVWALVVALASFGWLAAQIELARGAQPEPGTGLKGRRAAF